MESAALDTECAQTSDTLFGIGDYVRLQGLKSAKLNGSPGSVVEYVVGSGRYGVLLHGSSVPKAIKPENMVPYLFKDQELCPNCHKVLNLFSFPACGCKIPIIERSTSPSTERWPDNCTNENICKVSVHIFIYVHTFLYIYTLHIYVYVYIYVYI